MTSPKIDTLNVPGARLHYEMRGHGPVLLMIPGGTCDAGVYDFVAGLLADRYTVVGYDRRGQSRTTLEGPGSGQRVEEHADDAHRLLGALTDEPAHVFGNSSGAIVALDLLARHPEQVRAVVPHEPPMVELLPDAATHRELFAEVRALYHREGIEAAMLRFGEGAGLDQGSQETPDEADIPQEICELRQRIGANRPFFVDHEMCQFTAYTPDMSALRPLAQRVLPAVGRDSREQLPHRPSLVLAEQLGCPVTEFPGGHAGYISDAPEFAALLDQLLRGEVTG